MELAVIYVIGMVTSVGGARAFQLRCHPLRG